MERHSAFQTVTEARSRAFRKVTSTTMTVECPRADARRDDGKLAPGPRFQMFSFWGLTHPASIAPISKAELDRLPTRLGCRLDVRSLGLRGGDLLGRRRRGMPRMLTADVRTALRHLRGSRSRVRGGRYRSAKRAVTKGSGRPTLSGFDRGDDRRCVTCGADVGSRFIQRASSV